MSESIDLDDQAIFAGGTSRAISSKRLKTLAANYNWASGACLIYLALGLVLPMTSIDVTSSPIRIASEAAGWICVLYSVATAFYSMHFLFAVALAGSMAAFPPAAWLVVLLILGGAASELRACGCRFGLLGNVILPEPPDPSPLHQAPSRLAARDAQVPTA